jgi:peptide deformylase
MPIDPIQAMKLEERRRVVEADKQLQASRDRVAELARERIPERYRSGHAISLVFHPDARLKQKCVAVTEFDSELESLATNMLFTMYLCGGVGLAAPQVGDMRRLIVADWGEKRGAAEVLVNPRVEAESGFIRMTEACLSMPGAKVALTRSERITVVFEDLKGHAQARPLDGWPARIVQHEIDHLDGMIMLDRVSRLEKRMALKKIGKIARGERG